MMLTILPPPAPDTTAVTLAVSVLLLALMFVYLLMKPAVLDAWQRWRLMRATAKQNPGTPEPGNVLAATQAAKRAAARPSAPLPGHLTRGLDPKDREFLPAALELVETPPSPVNIAAIYLICGALMSALLWSYFGKLDIHAVAQGRIQPSGRSKVIQPLEPGKIAAIRIENGSRVEAGDVLLELDPTETGADRDAQKSDLEAMRAEAARRRTEIANARAPMGAAAKPISFDDGVGELVRRREEAVLAAEFSQLRSQQASLAAQLVEHTATAQKLEASVKAREKSIALARERVDMRTSLNDQGSLSRAMVIEVQSQYENLITTQVSEQGQLVEAQAQIKTTERKMEEAVSQFIAEQNQKLADAERKADRIAQDLIKATAKNERATLRAPIAGTVQQLAVTTIGQVVTSGQSLLTIVPLDGAIEIEALVQNQDIGFVEAGQQAVVKVDAFPFTRFGTVAGTVIKVSRDAVEEREAQGLSDNPAASRGNGQPQSSSGGRGQSLVFPATIKLNSSSIDVDGKLIPLSPGMAVTVEVRTGERRAIDYLLSPLRDVVSSSARER